MRHGKKRLIVLCCLFSVSACGESPEAPVDLGEFRIAVSASDLKWVGEIEYEIWRGDKVLLTGNFTDDVDQTCGEEGTHVLVPGEGSIRLIAKSANDWEWEFEHDDEGLPGCFKPRLDVGSSVTSVYFIARYRGEGEERGIPLTVSDENGIIAVAEKFAPEQEINQAMWEKGWSGLMEFWGRGEIIMIIRPPGRYVFTLRDPIDEWKDEVYFAPSGKSLAGYKW